MRRLLILLSLLSAAGCGAAGDSGSADNNQSVQARSGVERPADAVDRRDVIGAPPGPCGSTRAASALGKTFSPDLASEIKRLSGASEVNFVAWLDDGPPLQERNDPRRLNVKLSEDDRIILLQCG
jgi:hypothetical protein